jgi:hypothetical protein
MGGQPAPGGLFSSSYPFQGLQFPWERAAIQWRNRGWHRGRGPGHLAAERNPQNEPKTGPYGRSPVP